MWKYIIDNIYAILISAGVGFLIGLIFYIPSIISSNKLIKNLKDYIGSILIQGINIARESSKVPGKAFKLSNLEKEALSKGEYDKVKKEVHLSMQGNEIVSASEDIYYDNRKDVTIIPATLFIKVSEPEVLVSDVPNVEMSADDDTK